MFVTDCKQVLLQGRLKTMKKIFAILFVVVVSSFSFLGNVNAGWSDLFIPMEIYRIIDGITQVSESAYCHDNCYNDARREQQEVRHYRQEDRQYRPTRESMRENVSCCDNRYESSDCPRQNYETREYRNSIDVDAGASASRGPYINMHYSFSW